MILRFGVSGHGDWICGPLGFRASGGDLRV